MNLFEIIKQKFRRKQAMEKQAPRVKTVAPPKEHGHFRGSHYRKGRTGTGNAGNKLAKKCARFLRTHPRFPFLTAREGRKLIAHSDFMVKGY